MIPNDIEQRQKVITYMIEACTNNHKLSDWENDFITSVALQFMTKSNLSDKQCEILEKIYDKL